MSVTVELSELDADLWEAFKNGGPWVAHSEYMKLQAENAKLREWVKSREYIAFMLGEQTARVIKLQELVRDLYEMAYPERPSAFEVAFADRMRELGIEVDV